MENSNQQEVPQIQKPLQPYMPPTARMAKTHFDIKSFIITNKYIVIAVVLMAVVSLSSSVYLLAFGKKNPAAQHEVLPVIPEIVDPTMVPLSDNQASPSSETAVGAGTLESGQSATISATPTSTPTITPTPDPYATWKTYTSTEAGYSIKYPPDWTATNSAQTDPKILAYVLFNPIPVPKSGTAITISYTTRTLQEQLAISGGAQQQITVASVSATKTTEKDSNGNVTYHVIIPLKSNTYLNVIQQVYDDTSTKMLSTFKFLK